jgi:hypothetical protein
MDVKPSNLESPFSKGASEIKHGNGKSFAIDFPILNPPIVGDFPASRLIT